MPILDEVSFEIRLKIKDNFTGSNITNFVEISSYSNSYNLVDIDSKADNNNSNDAGGAPNTTADNYLDGNGLGPPLSDSDLTDEDDHAPAILAVQPLDLALVKKIDNSYNSQPIAVGEYVKFDIIVINQSEIAVDSVKIKDYVPIGLQFDVNHPLNIGNGWNTQQQTTLKNNSFPLKEIPSPFI